MNPVTIILPLVLLTASVASGESKNCNPAMCKTENECMHSECCDATPEELAGIIRTLDLYVDAAVKGDSRVAAPAFAPAATMSYADKGTLVSVPVQALFDYYDQTGPHPASYIVSACNVAGDVAMVRIESRFGDTRFADMFTLVRDGEHWKIVSKVYHVK